ncbi:MAG: metallo-mystery pair system four-Cys motif protein [Nannocystaceae bacterium]
MHYARALVLALAPSLVLACSDGHDDTAASDTHDTHDTSTEDRHVEIKLSAVVGAAPFACGVEFTDLGTTAAAAKFSDARFYVHDVAVYDAMGTRTPVMLHDNEWQGQGVALLDFEDATGECVGTPELNASITGMIPGDVTPTAVEFTIGVPEDLNHLDSSAATSPLNLPAMFWSWMGGYKFMKVDLTATGGPSFNFHLGSTMCTGDTSAGYTCAYGHRVTLRIDLSPDADTLLFDLAALVAASDLTTMNDPMVDPVKGCMSGASDPECPAIFATLGIEASSNDTHPETQTVFRRQGE